ncbi:unnamed protein product [Paramecium pentaurelia]|uniref:Peptidase C39-like domain-containing protein n=1 Tax=Paramecium pentaurelia TaxID=43138 RepID=A0A8S1UPZ3_9CILI|nr:unnamed protein product [Paramecium pentaurelia]
MGSFKNTVLILILLVTYGQGYTIRSITAYQNCDVKWGREQLNNNSSKSICQYGSLLSCVAMILQTSSKPINSRPVNPAVLNKYLMNNNGFKQGDEVNFSALEQVGLHFVKTVSDLKTAQEYFNSNHYIVLNINYGKNYGVLIGFDDSDKSNVIYYINNPIIPSETKVAAKDISVAIIFKAL